MSSSTPFLLQPADLVRLRDRNPGTRLLDVRTPGEFETQHIVGAYNVPLDTLGEHSAEIRARVTDPVVLVCRSGQRARKAEEALRSTGMANLHVLDGGMAAWVAAGQPVREGAPRMSLERQVRIAAGAVSVIGALFALFVHPLFATLPALAGAGLVLSGITDSCTLGMLLGRLSYNRPASCDVPAMIRALTLGVAPVAGGDTDRGRTSRAG